MKKLNLFLLTAILFLSFSMTNGQIKVSTAGKVKIGATTDASYPLEVNGDTHISGDLTVYAGFSQLSITDSYMKFRNTDCHGESVYFDEYNDEPSFFPSYNDGGYLGTSAKNFYKIYGRYVYLDGDIVLTSDSRLKENLRSLSSPLEKIKSVKGVKYDRIFTPNPKFNEEKLAEMEARSKDNIGFIAQDLMEVYPELVDYDKEADKYGVNYIGMIPVLVEAIKEQQVIIEEIQAEILKLNSSSLKSLVLSGEIESLVSDQCLLHQNTPNPFGETTSISYNLPEGTTNADIIIYDMTGKQLRRIPLTEDGESSIEASGGEMDPGMYMYSMIVENQHVDTKQMIITE